MLNCFVYCNLLCLHFFYLCCNRMINKLYVQHIVVNSQNHTCPLHVIQSLIGAVKQYSNKIILKNLHTYVYIIHTHKHTHANIYTYTHARARAQAHTHTHAHTQVPHQHIYIQLVAYNYRLMSIHISKHHVQLQ